MHVWPNSLHGFLYCPSPYPSLSTNHKSTTTSARTLAKTMKCLCLFSFNDNPLQNYLLALLLWTHTHVHTYTHSIVCRDGTHNHALLPLDQMDRRLGSSCTKHPLVTVFLTLTSNATRTSTDDDDDIVLLYIRLLTRLTCYYAASLTVIVFSSR